MASFAVEQIDEVENGGVRVGSIWYDTACQPVGFDPRFVVEETTTVGNVQTTVPVVQAPQRKYVR